MLRVSATTDLSAIARNCGVLNERSGTAQLCAVVKADAYGHAGKLDDTMLAVATAALRGGASWLAVAAAEEALSLRQLGLQCPVLTMGAVSTYEIDRLLAADCDLAVWSTEALDRALASAEGGPSKARLHVKLDTGMGRLGTGDPDFAMELVERIAGHPSGELAGVMTHFATADEEDDNFLLEQLERFTAFAAEVKSKVPDALAHAANSAATLRLPASHLDMVRCGVAIYGLDPFGRDPAEQGLSPAIEWRSAIGRLKRFAPGESAGYGRRFIAERETVVATAPVGYADGYRRVLGGKAEAIVGGRRVPVVGTVSMDNIALDLGPDATAEVGDEVILIGASGGETVLAEDLARLAGTINYEIVTGIGGRTVKTVAE